MLCQALIAAVAVTYLMCVLLLSGTQKEDLDVSMLTKLQRHNVNINDMNNEQLLQTCLQPQANSSDEAKKITVTRPLNKIKNNFLEDKTTSHSDVSKYPRATENYPNRTRTFYQSSRVAVFQKNNDTALEKNVYDEVTQDKDIRPKLGTHDMIINIADDQLMKKRSSLAERERKRSILEITNSSESDTLNSLLAIFLAKRNLSTKSTTTPIFINVDDVDAKLYSMRMRDTETNGNSGLKHHFTYLPIQPIARKSTIQEETIDKESETNRENPNMMNQTNSSNAIILLNPFKSFNPFIPNTEIISNLNSKTTDNLDWSSNRYLSSFQKSDTTSATNIEPKLKISRDIIKEIADNVKEIILRDLRKELHETTTVTTTTVTRIMSTKAVYSTTIRESEFQRTMQKENPNTQDSVMSKFQELFELIKSLKQNTTDVKSETKKDIIKKERSHKINFEELNVYPHREIPPTLPNSLIQNQLPYHTNQFYVMQQHPFLNSEKKFHFPPHLHEYRSHGSIMNQPPILKQPINIKQEPNNGLLPLTVQTNNIEIPPLGIPLDTSQNLIRQNIIVSTRAPYNIVPNKNGRSSQSKKGVQHRGSRHSEAGEVLNAYKSKYINPRLSNEPHTPPSHNIQPKRNDVIRFTLKNNEDSKYNAHYYEKINLGKYKPHPKSDETNYQEIPRFHQKLEKIERFLDYPEENKNTDRNDCCDFKFGYLKAMVDCCNRKVASRQQMPLNNMKRQSYDDGHYKNFLQSQQKVTDMLERILRDKGTVHSVETA